MAVIQIDDQADRVRAIDVLAGTGKTYHRSPGNRFIVSDEIPRLLQARGVRFIQLGRIEPGEGEEAESATNP